MALTGALYTVMPDASEEWPAASPAAGWPFELASDGAGSADGTRRCRRETRTAARRTPSRRRSPRLLSRLRVRFTTRRRPGGQLRREAQLAAAEHGPAPRERAPPVLRAVVLVEHVCVRACLPSSSLACFMYSLPRPRPPGCPFGGETGRRGASPATRGSGTV